MSFVSVAGVLIEESAGVAGSIRHPVNGIATAPDFGGWSQNLPVSRGRGLEAHTGEGNAYPPALRLLEHAGTHLGRGQFAHLEQAPRCLLE